MLVACFVSVCVVHKGVSYDDGLYERDMRIQIDPYIYIHKLDGHT